MLIKGGHVPLVPPRFCRLGSWSESLVNLLLSLVVVFEACKIKGVTLLWATEAGYPRKARENKRSHTDSIYCQP